METQNAALQNTNLEDLTGRTFGRWTVLGFSKKEKGLYYWTARCTCGVVRDVLYHSLTGYKSQSCGCLGVENRNAKITKHGHSIGGKRSPELRTYRNMLARCTNPNATEYFRYGAKGIKVCERWMTSFEAFLEDMGPKPSAKHSIDRIDSAGDYSKENCRWATIAEQTRNRASNVFITWNARTLCMSDWATELGITKATLHWRLNNWGLERAMTTVICREPDGQAVKTLLTFNGRTMSYTAWAAEINVSAAQLRWRVKNWGVERALTTPPAA